MNTAILKQALQEKKMTQEQLAHLCNVERSHISKILSGKTLPSIPVLVRLSEALDLSIEAILTN